MNRRQRQRGNPDGDQAVAQIAVRIELPRRAPPDVLVAAVDCVADQRCRHIGGRRIPCQNGHGIGDAEAERAPTRAGCSDTANAGSLLDRDLAATFGQGIGLKLPRHGNPQLLAWRAEERDVAAVVDEGAGECCIGQHGGKELVSDSTRHGRHGRDEASREGPAGRCHAASDPALGHWPLAEASSESRQLLAEFGKDATEAGHGGTLGGSHRGGRSVGLQDDVDRSLRQVEAATVETLNDRRRAGRHGHETLCRSAKNAAASSSLSGASIRAETAAATAFISCVAARPAAVNSSTTWRPS